MANHYDGIAGKVREELALDELCCNERYASLQEQNIV